MFLRRLCFGCSCALMSVFGCASESREAVSDELVEVLSDAVEATDALSMEAESCEPLSGESLTWYSGVGKLFLENCTVCHAEQPLYGAPMSLATYGSTLGPSGLNKEETLSESIARVVKDGSMPPASQIVLSEEDKTSIVSWAENCAPEGEETEIEVDSLVKNPVPPPPEDAEIFVISTDNFLIPQEDDRYMCFPRIIEFEGDKDIVRIDYEQDKKEVIHHMVMYADPDHVAGTEPFECLHVAVNGAEFMFEWGPGGLPIQFPEGTGFPVKSGNSVVFQIHYNNASRYTNLVDNSKLKVYLQDPQEEKVAMLAAGPISYVIPPFEEVFVESTCPITQETRILTSAPHMHEAGRSFYQEIQRADGTIETFVDMNEWNFFSQPLYHTEIVLYPGDKILTRCGFENTGAVPLVGGDDTFNEMCFNFMYHTPPMATLFCIEDTGLQIISPEETLGECTKESDLPVGPLVEMGTIFEGGPEFIEGDQEFPEGPWVLTSGDAYLPHFGERVYEVVNLDESEIEMRASILTVDALTYVDMSLALYIKPIDVPAVLLGNVYSGTGSLVWDQVFSAHVWGETLCQQDTFLELKYFRLYPVEDRLEGSFALTRQADGEDIHVVGVWERPEGYVESAP